MRYSRIKIETNEQITEQTLRTALLANSAVSSVETITTTEHGYNCIVVASPAAVNLTQIQDAVDESIQSVWVRRHFTDDTIAA